MAKPRFPTKEEENEFYAALGRAVTDWAALERELFEIVVSILATTRKRAAIVFYRTPTIDSRLTLTNDLVLSELPAHEPGKQPHAGVKEWKGLQADIKEELPTRNQLAHQPVSIVTDIYGSPDGENLRFEIKQASYMSEGEALRKPKNGGKTLTLPDIETHLGAVTVLTTRLHDFRKQHFPGPLLKPVE